MILHMWSTDVDGNTIDIEDNVSIEVDSRAHATSFIVTELHNTASDEFMDEALNQWFVSGKVDSLHEGGEAFWNVKFV